jgi:Spy/CpxP family protein refolding chaperone
MTKHVHRLMFGAMLLVFALAASPAAAQARKPNLLIIWGDDIGWYNVSAGSE